MNKYRTHNCYQLSEKDIGKLVNLSGWLHRKRDHGNLLFIDLRDHYGITQCVIENNNKFFKVLEKIRSESVIKIAGKVVKRTRRNRKFRFKNWQNRSLHTILLKFYEAKEFLYLCLENKITLKI